MASKAIRASTRLIHDDDLTAVREIVTAPLAAEKSGALSRDNRRERNVLPI
jgi:hypothetical protein